jgi:DNA invertase Pin-like site-specific DNA recombinase
MSVYGYVRASTVDQKDTLTVQEEKIKKYCELKELPKPEIYIDSGVSGSTDFKDRPEAKKIWEKLKENDYIIVAKLDRISRNMENFVFMMNYFKKQKINFKCLDPDIDTASTFGAFMLNILGSISELERSMTIDRVKATIQKRKSENLCVGSVPFGWDKVGDKNKKEVVKLVENKQEQDIIKQILIMYKDEKLNNKKIADKLNNLKVLGRKWYSQQIARIIKRNS